MDVPIIQLIIVRKTYANTNWIFHALSQKDFMQEHLFSNGPDSLLWWHADGFNTRSSAGRDWHA